MAERAAKAAGVLVREVTDLTELESLADLFAEIWGSDPGRQPMSADLLRALTKSGGYVAGAFDGSSLAGGCVAFFGPPAERSLHSHIAGVSEQFRGRHIGFALKTHQRAWARRQGVAAITWTFDPLVRRNAYFNLARLGAQSVEYLPNFYGNMYDGINRGAESDRMLVRWELANPLPGGGTRPTVATPVLVAGAGGEPVRLAMPESGAVSVAVPDDVESLRRLDPSAAASWRAALREVLGGLMSRGGLVAGFDPGGWYVVVPPTGISNERGES
ncbi:MAG TPA: GNAT family N-acetyltransferase [Nocardioidaceae bacterium]|nr:GNAT family N-acetyltransferase [Nocardioidaceae bacterium]